MQPGFFPDDKPLPLFRKDLELYQGPDNTDGSPSYNLYDPVRSQFYQFSWGEAQILQYLQPGMTVTELIKVLDEQTTLKVIPEDIQRFFEYAARYNLLAIPKPSEILVQQAEKVRGTKYKWTLFNYLYFRIPLLNPDNFLSRTIHFVRPFASKFAFFIYFILSLAGFILLSGRLDQYLHTFTYFFNWEGLFVYALAITSVKIIHEFSHAYTAKHYGIYVPSMGFAFIVFWPVLYTDVTHGWKLWKLKQRLAISFAGIAAELTIAGMCTLGWAVTSPGYLNSVFFVISSATWITTLLINLNPAMRFDGYYLLSDLWGIDNLQPRAFSMTRWKLRKSLLGLNVPPPEEGISSKRLAGMMTYSIYTWIYRVLLYLTVAIIIYYKFTKALGILLFIIEIYVFLLWPIASEIYELKQLKQAFTKNLRIVMTSIVALFLIGWFILPIPHTINFHAITVPVKKQVIYVPHDAVVQKLYVKRGDPVKPGDPLILLHSKQLENEIANLYIQRAILQKEIINLTFDDANRPYIPEKSAELARILENLKRKIAQQEELKFHAETKGIVYKWDKDLKIGQSVSKDKVIGKIGDTKNIEVICFVPERMLRSVKLHQPAEFFASGSLSPVKGRIEKIHHVRAEVLHYPPLATLYSGPLPVTFDYKKPSNDQLKMVDSFYPVKIVLKKHTLPLRFGQVGYVRIRGTARSKLFDLIRYAISIIWRESGV